MCPGVDDLVVTILLSHKTEVVVGGNLVDSLLTLLHNLLLLRRHDDVVEVEGQTGKVRHAVAEVLDTVEERAGTGHTHVLDNVGDELAE